VVRMRKGSGRLSLGSIVAFFVFVFFFFFLFLFFSFFFFCSFSVSSFRSGFRSGGRDWERAGRGEGREGRKKKEKGGREGGGEGRIRWGDGLVLDAFGLFLFLLVWEDEEKVSPLFSGSFRIFFWVNHRFVIRSGPAS
jgi:hypothetical protein